MSEPIPQVALVARDEGTLAHAAADLRALGFEPRTCRTGEDALDWIRAHDTRLAVCDSRLPDMDGLELLDRLRQEGLPCELILVVPDGDTERAIRALREGATDFVEAPITAGALQAVIERTRRFQSLAEEQRLLSGRVHLLSHALHARTAGDSVMVGQSEPMRRVAQEILAVADTTATILVLGESGTGKEVIANAIHQNSARRGGPFLAVNCSSIADNLFESEMFGHRRGAFTGAVETRTGYVEAADGGTLFMDEIGDLPIGSQAKILRLLEQKSYVRVGETTPRAADVRIVAATNQPLEELMRRKAFREDLYYRLSVCTIRLPPLRERREDIPLLADYFVFHFASELGKPIEGLSDDAMDALAHYPFPGNVRELRNIIESSVIRCRHDGLLRAGDLPLHAAPHAAPVTGPTWPLGSFRFEEVERTLYRAALEETGHNVSAAARLMGIDRSRLRRRMRALEMQ